MGKINWYEHQHGSQSPQLAMTLVDHYFPKYFFDFFPYHSLLCHNLFTYNGTSNRSRGAETCFLITILGKAKEKLLEAKNSFSKKCSYCPYYYRKVVWPPRGGGQRKSCLNKTDPGLVLVSCYLVEDQHTTDKVQKIYCIMLLACLKGFY